MPEYPKIEFDYIIDIDKDINGMPTAIGHIYLDCELIYRVFMNSTNKDWMSVGFDLSDPPRRSDFEHYLKARFASTLYRVLKDH